jgi:hypothetical protein
MPRIEFDGQGLPIPKIALPPMGGDEDIPTTVLVFKDNVDFSVKQYQDLGFTHFEAWCIGAAGGRGGDSSSQIFYAAEEIMRPVPQDVWNLRLEQASYDDWWAQNAMYTDAYYNDPYFHDPSHWPPGWVHAYGAAPPGFIPAPVLNYVYTLWYTYNYVGDYPYLLPEDHWAFREMKLIQEFGVNTEALRQQNLPLRASYAQLFDMYHPTHMLRFRTIRDALLYPTTDGMGGGGGGGGMHHVAGALADLLSETVPIEVGKAGIDAGFGQTIAPGVVTADLSLSLPDPNAQVGPYKVRMQEIMNYLTLYTNSFPGVHPSWGNPQPGQDGGASSFAMDVCQASGGKGGGPGKVWDGAKFVRKGDGGDGGLGGRAMAGGGGAGSTVFGANGSDGSWHPETGVGGGGGGGKAAADPPPPVDPRFGYQQQPAPLPTAGGRGSFSFADTSVYGPRQSRQAWTYVRPSNGPQTIASDGLTQVALSSGQIIYLPTTTSDPIIPGGGGGARPLSNLKYGSNAPGYSPNGVVVVRLSRIT